MTSARQPVPERRGPYRLYLLLGLAVIVTGFLFRSHLIAWLWELEHWVEDAGPWAPILMSVVCSVWAILCLPGPPILGLVGTMFSEQPLLGLLIVMIGDTAATIFGFLVARHVGRRFVLERLESKPWFAWLETNVNERGLYGVFLIRMMPFFPNSLANYALGLSPLRFWPYLAASVSGSIPNLALYIYGTAGIVELVRHGFASGLSLHAALLGLLLVALAARALQGWLRGRVRPGKDA